MLVLFKFTFEGIAIDLVYVHWDVDIINIDKSTKYKQINALSNQSTQTIKKLIPNKNYKLSHQIFTHNFLSILLMRNQCEKLQL